MTEKDIMRFLEETAANSGLTNARFVIENASKYPCAVYINLLQKDGPTAAGFGKTFAEAIEHAKSRMSQARDLAETRTG